MQFSDEPVSRSGSGNRTIIWVRNQDEFGRILAYIENNPMKAGLVAEATQYRWSSAWIATAN
jgi:hypothetical protein